MNELIWFLIGIGTAGPVGYYLGHRGFVGVKSDLKDVKEDVTKIKTKLNSKKSKANVA